MTTPIDILRYWRASLADGQLPSFPVKSLMREIDWDAVRAGVIGTELAKKLVFDWQVSNNAKVQKGNRPGAKSELASVPVLIAPLVFIARHSHGTSGRRSDKPYAPLIVPAQMALDGKLSFDPSKHLPWLWRGALEPSAGSEPPLGSLDEFDVFRSSTPRPEDSDWRKLIKYTNCLCEALTGSALANVAIDGYDRAPAMIMAALPPSSPSQHLITLADSLIAQEERLPETFVSGCRRGPMRPQIETSTRWDASARHLGQMGADYPLADRQREAIHHLAACTDGEILPVNGPPGTGKTTLLQSIVATMVVKAALEGSEPPIIAVTSTNNQAITNVIDSFAKGEPLAHRLKKPLEGRWLPGLKSFALYLPTASKEVDENKYHVARLPDYGKPLSGMPADMLRGDAVTKSEIAFLAAARAAFGREFSAVAEVGAELHSRLAEGAVRLKECIALLGFLVSQRAARPDDTAEGFATWVKSEVADAEARIDAHTQVVATARRKAETAREQLKKASEAIGRGLEELSPPGTGLGALLGWLLGFLPSVRAGRWERCRRIIRAVGIEDGPFASLVVPTNLTALRLNLDGYLASLHQMADAAEYRANQIEHAEEEGAASVRVRLDALNAEADAWLAAEQNWGLQVNALYSAAAEFGSVKMISPADVIARPESVEKLLDVTLRYELFLLAAHYWEGRWLQSALRLVDEADDPVKVISLKSRQRTEARWRLMACLTPCFVSTLFMLPKHLQFHDPEGDNKNPPLTGFVDLLIVDEAGQVPAEIGGVGLSLGRKALVVGDIHQIEPIWSVGREIDEGNISRYGLRHQAEHLDKVGSSAASGSLMRIARHASAFAGKTKNDPGIFLAEHRRCQAPIIAVCNDLVYANRLIPCTSALSEPILPPLGWANVRSPSERRGGSRFNAGEAEAIAEWLGRRRGEIENRYRKPIQELVAIVTPFSAQKSVIRSALGRHNIEGDLTIGTVHALQGAEREIVLFSTVHTAEDGGRPYFDNGPNMINVAVSRARHSFLVFGDMRVFDPDRAVEKLPSGVLAKHLFARPEHEILDVLTRPDFLTEETAAHTIRLDSLEAHQQTLREAFERASRRVLVVSPYLSIDAVTRDGVETLVAAARDRKVDVTIAFDPQLNQKFDRLRTNCAEAAEALAKVGAEIVERARIHNKTLAMDDTWIVEGSFNWLSAVRDPNLPYARMERSLRYEGPNAGEYVKDAWREIMG